MTNFCGCFCRLTLDRLCLDWCHGNTFRNVLLVPESQPGNQGATSPSLQTGLGKTRVAAMSTVAEIEAAITRLPTKDAEQLREWLEQWLEDQMEMTPEFEASIERGKADLAAGRSRIVRP